MFHSFRLKMGLERWTLKNFCFCRGPRFSSQRAHDSSQLSHFSPTGSDTLFTPPRVPGMRTVPRHACEQSAETPRKERIASPPAGSSYFLHQPDNIFSGNKGQHLLALPKTPGNPQSYNRSHSFSHVLSQFYKSKL